MRWAEALRSRPHLLRKDPILMRTLSIRLYLWLWFTFGDAITWLGLPTPV